MTRIPFADWRPTPVNFTKDDVVRPPNGLVLHIAQGSYEGTISWATNPKARVSYYAVVAKDGRIAQVVDLDNKAWTQSAGNARWIGVEFEGFVPDSLTPAQITAAAKLLAFFHTKYGVPLVATDSPTGAGLGWHGMGGDAWGGHQGCPGPAIVAQRPRIIAEAQQLVGQTPTPIPPHTVSAPFGEGLGMERIETTVTLDEKGNGWFPVKGVKAKDVFSVTPLTGDPAAGGYRLIPRVGLTIGLDGNAEVVIEGGRPSARCTVRVIHV